MTDEVSGEFSESEREALARGEFAVCVATFYGDLAERLLNGAAEGFSLGGVSEASVETFRVPGAFELPYAAKLCADSGRFAGVACLGVVIRGETDHYDFVCSQAAAGIQRVQLDTGVPCAFGVITCDTMEQAEARADGSKRDQGRNAAIAVMRSAALSV
ncbi:6,7-dimethyl-8-ribityllumazine synthase [soil metagenome]